MRDIDTLTRSLQRTENKLEATQKSNERLRTDAEELKRQIREMERAGRMYAKDVWYVTYLQIEMSRIERQYDILQDNFHMMVDDNRKVKALLESIHVL